jgi:mannose-6-phosphate isomerase-like protein (cupin superfamily)
MQINWDVLVRAAERNGNVVTAEAELDWPTTTGVIDTSPNRIYRDEDANVSLVYQDQDINVVVWNLLPGQVTDSHKHPENAHTFLVVCGEGEYLREGDAPVPIKTGEIVIIPRETVHVIRNTGSVPLSYIAVSSIGQHGYHRVSA